MDKKKEDDKDDKVKKPAQQKVVTQPQPASTASAKDIDTETKLKAEQEKQRAQTNRTLIQEGGKLLGKGLDLLGGYLGSKKSKTK